MWAQPGRDMHRSTSREFATTTLPKSLWASLHMLCDIAVASPHACAQSSGPCSSAYAANRGRHLHLKPLWDPAEPPYNHQRVLALPYNAFATSEVYDRYAELIVQNICACKSGSGGLVHQL